MRVTRRVLLAAAMSGVLVAPLAPEIADAEPARADPALARASVVPAINTYSKLKFGVVTPGGPTAGAEIDAVAQLVGEAPSVLMTYKDFNQGVPIAELNASATRGATTMVTWEPWKAAAGAVQPAYASARITAGDFDAYILSWATGLKAWGKPLLLRYAHEMNGTWYPWADGVNGNSSGDYVAAWRHVHDIFTAAGVTNVTWVWSPNIPSYTRQSTAALTSLYPGGQYTDAVALDGYNWGSGPGTVWASPSGLFYPGLRQLRLLAPGKKIYIAEVGSAEAGGSKADWNTALVKYLAGQSDIAAFIWFDIVAAQDWRIDSSASSAAALKAILPSRGP